MTDYITKVQACDVEDLVPVDRLQEWGEGILNILKDWTSIVAIGSQVLHHRCDNRCISRINDTGNDKKDYICRKSYAVLGKYDTNKQEWIPLLFTLSSQCLRILRNCSLYEDQTPRALNWTFNSH